jgi:hypothetical protein
VVGDEATVELVAVGGAVVEAVVVEAVVIEAVVAEAVVVEAVVVEVCEAIVVGGKVIGGRLGHRVWKSEIPVLVSPEVPGTMTILALFVGLQYTDYAWLYGNDTICACLDYGLSSLSAETRDGCAGIRQLCRWSTCFCALIEIVSHHAPRLHKD